MKSLVPEDYARLVRLSSLAAAPDGTLAYVKYFWQDHSWQRRVELSKDGKTEIISLGGTREVCPVFSGDGRLLWLLSDGRVVLHDRYTGVTREAFPLEEGFEAVDVLPLSGGCVFVCRKEVRETPPEGCDWQMPLVTEELHFRNDGDHGWKKKYVYRLCVYKGNVRILAEENAPFRSLAVLPDESAALYAQDGFCLISFSDGEIRKIPAPFAPGGDIRPAVAGNGSYALVAASCGMETCLRRLWLDGQEHAPDQIENEPDGLSVGLYMDETPERESLVAPGLDPDTFFVSAVQDHIPALWRVEVRENRIVYTDLCVPCLPVETAGETALGIAVMAGSIAYPPRPAFVSRPGPFPGRAGGADGLPASAGGKTGERSPAGLGARRAFRLLDARLSPGIAVRVKPGVCGPASEPSRLYRQGKRVCRSHSCL